MCSSGKKKKTWWMKCVAFGLPLTTTTETTTTTVRGAYTLTIDPANERTEMWQQEENNSLLVSVRNVQKSSRISLSKAARSAK